MITTNLFEISYLLYAFMIIGVIASSISGALRAIEASMDITGAVLLAFFNANAGGTIRDLILGTQIFWIRDQFYIWLTLSVGCFTFILVYFQNHFISNRKLYKALVITDAMGLAAFSLAGVAASLGVGQNNVIAVIMGVWTAIGGGVIADIIANRVPLVFSQELYITVAFLGSVCYLCLSNFSVNNVIAGIISTFLMILLRLCSVKYKWKFPTIGQNSK